MPMRHIVASILFAAVLFLPGGCASLTGSDPVQVTVAGIEPLPGEGLEARMLVKLRVQNPNDAPIEYDGVYVKLDVLERTFATGVSDARGVVPRFGETIIAVPVTVSVLRMAGHALRLLDGKPVERIDYELEGKLSGGAFGSRRFRASGAFKVPADPAPAPAPSQ
jgi:LEA14-like dessication related protein